MKRRDEPRVAPLIVLALAVGAFLIATQPIADRVAVRAKAAAEAPPAKLCAECSELEARGEPHPSCVDGGCKKCLPSCCRPGHDKCCCLHVDECTCPPQDPTGGEGGA